MRSTNLLTYLLTDLLTYKDIDDDGDGYDEVDNNVNVCNFSWLQSSSMDYAGHQYYCLRCSRCYSRCYLCPPSVRMNSLYIYTALLYPLFLLVLLLYMQWLVTLLQEILQVNVKVKVPILVIEPKGPELIPDSRQSACRWQHA